MTRQNRSQWKTDGRGPWDALPRPDASIHRARSIGAIPKVMVKPSYLWLIYPCTQGYLALAYVGLGPLLGTTRSCALGPTDSIIGQGVFFTFAALVMQGLSSYMITCAGPKRSVAHIMHPPTAVYAIVSRSGARTVD